MKKSSSKVAPAMGDAILVKAKGHINAKGRLLGGGAEFQTDQDVHFVQAETVGVIVAADGKKPTVAFEHGRFAVIEMQVPAELVAQI